MGSDIGVGVGVVVDVVVDVDVDVGGDGVGAGRSALWRRRPLDCVISSGAVVRVSR